MMSPSRSPTWALRSTTARTPFSVSNRANLGMTTFRSNQLRLSAAVTRA